MDIDLFQREMARLVSAIAPMRPSPMLHEIWFRACAEGLNPDEDFEIISVDSAGKPVAAAAFVRRRRLVSSLCLLGAEDLWEPSDLLYEDRTAASALAEKIVKRGLPVRFGHFVEESFFVEALQKAAHGKGFVMADPVGGAPYIRLDDSWRAPEKKFSKRKQADLRRRRKKANARGAMDTEIITPRTNEVDALLDEAIRVEGSGWKGRSGTALKSNKKQQAFFRTYARLASEAGIFRLAFLRIGGQTAAVRICVECDGKFWGFKTGYDETFKEFSPGMFLFIDIVRHAANAGLSTHEFLGNAAQWTREWTTDEHPLIRFRYYPFNIAGAAALCWDGVAATARRLKTRFAGSKKK